MAEKYPQVGLGKASVLLNYEPITTGPFDAHHQFILF
jgi:hypothetical protein